MAKNTEPPRIQIMYNVVEEPATFLAMVGLLFKMCPGQVSLIEASEGLKRIISKYPHENLGRIKSGIKDLYLKRQEELDATN